MPTSHIGQINTILEIITTIKPKRLLDIGVGHGKYGFLSREYLEVSENTDDYSRRSIRLDGIEAFPDYITDLQRNIYDQIFIGNAVDVIDTVESYDLIMLIDVFEHFKYDEGMALLRKCLSKSKLVLISCPKTVEFQGAEYNNKYEIHQFEWKKSHFAGFPSKAFFPNYYSLIVLLGNDANQIKQNWASSNFRLRVAAKFPVVKKIYLWLKAKTKRDEGAL